MSTRGSSTILLILLLLLFFQHSVYGAENQSKPKVVIHANKIHYSVKNEIITATGNVSIVRESTRITGDYAVLENKTDIGTIEGNVTIDDPENSIKSARAILNLKSRIGVIYDASGVISSKYHFTGKRVERLSENKYKILDGSFTTCCETRAPWKIAAKKIDLHLEEYAYVSQSSFKIMGFPIFYTPYFVVPVKTKRQTGLLPPLFGGSGDEGITMTNTFFWAINESHDATLSWQHKERRGEKFGLEYRYMLSAESFGTFESSHTFDYEPKDQTNSVLWKVNYDHHQTLPYGAKGLIHIDQVSNTNPDREFDIEDLEARTKRYTDSYVNISKNWSSRSIQLGMRRRESTGSTDTSQFDEIPTLTFSNTSEQIGPTPFYFSIESSFKGFRKTKDGPSAENIRVNRADALPTLSLPLAPFPWMSLTPTASYRETWYSSGNENKSFFRGFFEGGLSATGPKFFRIFHFKKSDLKHLIEPGLSFSHISGIEKSIKDQIIEFDDIDKAGRVEGPEDILTYSVSNILLKKTPLAGVHEIARLTLGHSFDIQEARREQDTEPNRPFGDISFILQTRLHPTVKFDYYNTFDVYNKTVLSETVDLDINFPGASYFTLERRKKRDRGGASSTSITDIGTFGIKIMDKLKIEAGIHYDELNSIRKESDYAITYGAGCWEISFDAINRRINDEAGERHETKLFFSVTLKDIITYGEKGPLGFVKRRL